MGAFVEAKVLDVKHWTDTLFSFRVTRDPAFRFENGEFVMVGLMVDGKALMRAYSMASANYEEDLEFFSIKVQNGPLTSRLQHIQVGDTILLGRKATGTLLADSLLPGQNLYLFSTGTGLAPFASLIKDPHIYERFQRVILTHTVRQVAELAYGEQLVERLRDHELVGDMVSEQLSYYPTVTREPFRVSGRITELIRNGQLFRDLDLPTLNLASDRAMVCGGPDMLAETVELLEELGFRQGTANNPGEYVIEKAFVEK